ncbi:hypothetical protein H4R33_002052 [Dimargaris cristalligena]|nr:hypothetical protein H4R33_002052 [Dimargaris cristalligena]
MMSLLRNLSDKQKKPSRVSSEKALPSVPRRIRLDDILCGCTTGVVSLPNFRRFLHTREHSVENLNFYEWYIIYCTRWSILEAELQNMAPALDYYPSSHHIPYFSLTEQEMVPFNPRPASDSESESSSTKSRKNDSHSSLVHDSFDLERTRPTKIGITVQARIYLGELSNNQLSVKRPPFLVALESALTPDIDEASDSDMDSLDGAVPTKTMARDTSAVNKPKSRATKLATSVSSGKSYSDTHLPTAKSKTRQPFRREIDHCVSRFFSSYSPDELNIPQQIRQQVVHDAKLTTHPAVFEVAFREIYKMLGRSVQDHFLKFAEQQYLGEI